MCCKTIVTTTMYTLVRSMYCAVGTHTHTVAVLSLSPSLSLSLSLSRPLKCALSGNGIFVPTCKMCKINSLVWWQICKYGTVLTVWRCNPYQNEARAQRSFSLSFILSVLWCKSFPRADGRTNNEKPTIASFIKHRNKKGQLIFIRLI